MATIDDLQILLDISKKITTINDLVDYASFICRGINPNTGETPFISRDTGLPYNLIELKRDLNQIKSNVIIEYDPVGKYIAKKGMGRVAIALGLLGIDAEVARARLENLRAVILAVIPQVQAATSLDDLVLVADYIDAHTEKLDLVRREWNLPIT